MKREMRKGFFFVVLILVAASVPVNTLGAETGATEKGVIETLNEALKERDQIIQGLLKRMETLEKEVRFLRDSSVPEKSLQTPSGEEEKDSSSRGQGTAVSATGSTPSPAEREEEERLARAALDRMLEVS